MAIEHNDEEPKRTDLLSFLEAKGYRRVHSYKQDDFYAPALAPGVSASFGAWA